MLEEALLQHSFEHLSPLSIRLITSNFMPILIAFLCFLSLKTPWYADGRFPVIIKAKSSMKMKHDVNIHKRKQVSLRQRFVRQKEDGCCCVLLLPHTLCRPSPGNSVLLSVATTLPAWTDCLARNLNRAVPKKGPHKLKIGVNTTA